MGDSASLDDLFRAAVSAIDAGDIPELSRHLIAHPSLISDRLETPGSWLRDKVGNALVNGNFAAAAHLVDRGATLTLSTALCLERWDDVDRLGAEATLRQKQFALTLAALKGKTEALRRIIALGADVNSVSQDLYSHASPCTTPCPRARSKPSNFSSSLERISRHLTPPTRGRLSTGLNTPATNRSTLRSRRTCVGSKRTVERAVPGAEAT